MELMSHFSTVKTELRQLEPLFRPSMISVTPPSRGSVQSVDIAVRPLPLILAVAMQEGGDLGFRWNSVMVPMSWSPTWTSGSPFRLSVFAVTQRYAFNTVLSASDREGFQVAEQRVTQDGSIELVVTRWDA